VDDAMKDDMPTESPGVFTERQLADIDEDLRRQPRTMPGLNMAALAMLAAPLPTWMLGPSYSPPRVPQTEDQRVAALRAAEEKRLRRRAKRAATR
jgi:hypothetical protein